MKTVKLIFCIAIIHNCVVASFAGENLLDIAKWNVNSNLEIYQTPTKRLQMRVKQPGQEAVATYKGHYPVTKESTLVLHCAILENARIIVGRHFFDSAYISTVKIYPAGTTTIEISLLPSNLDRRVDFVDLAIWVEAVSKDEENLAVIDRLEIREVSCVTDSPKENEPNLLEATNWSAGPGIALHSQNGTLILKGNGEKDQFILTTNAFPFDSDTVCVLQCERLRSKIEVQAYFEDANSKSLTEGGVGRPRVATRAVEDLNEHVIALREFNPPTTARYVRVMLWLSPAPNTNAIAVIKRCEVRSGREAALTPK